MNNSNFRILTLSVCATLAMSSASLAARGDNGEGQGGGKVQPAPILIQQPYTEYEWQTQMVPRTVSETIQYPCSQTIAIPATLSPECHSNTNKEESFDDFASGCKIEPARNEVIPLTCSRVETKTVYDEKQVQVAVTKYKDIWQCPKYWPKLVEKTARGKTERYCTTK